MEIDKTLSFACQHSLWMSPRIYYINRSDETALCKMELAELWQWSLKLFFSKMFIKLRRRGGGATISTWIMNGPLHRLFGIEYIEENIQWSKSKGAFFVWRTGSSKGDNFVGQNFIKIILSPLWQNLCNNKSPSIITILTSKIDEVTRLETDPILQKYTFYFINCNSCLFFRD